MSMHFPKETRTEMDVGEGHLYLSSLAAKPSRHQKNLDR